MINQEKIRLMTRLAILEKQHGKQIRKAENAFRIDLLTNPVWKMGFFVSLLFAAAAGILMLLNINMFLDAFASGQLKALIMAVLIIYGSLLLITVILTAIRSGRSCRKAVYYQEQYRSLLEKIHKMEPDSRRSSSRYASDTDDWEDDDIPRDVPKGKRKREDLDYRHMETLEFEDDEYSYYVEATPKRGGRQR